MLASLAAGFVAMANAKDSLDILVMADWGGAPKSPYTTPDEVDSAKMMGDVGKTYEVDMVWGLGDNFYDNGVVNEHDSRFKNTFEDVFDASSLSKVPFYMVAGNHDHYGNVTGEIEYSNHSSRWRFPDYWYSHSFKVPGTNYTLQLVMIDTVLLDGISFSQEFCDKVSSTAAPRLLGSASSTRAAAPATCGQAMDVPLLVVEASSSSIPADKILLPGAQMFVQVP